jgi:uncharacterized membrane protein YwzB
LTQPTLCCKCCSKSGSSSSSRWCRTRWHITSPNRFQLLAKIFSADIFPLFFLFFHLFTLQYDAFCRLKLDLFIKSGNSFQYQILLKLIQVELTKYINSETLQPRIPEVQFKSTRKLIKSKLWSPELWHHGIVWYSTNT